MKKNKTKSILACAVLASVLAGGMVPVQAADVKALVAPKDFANCTYINGKEVTFGQKQGYSNNQFEITDPQKVTVIDSNPTWQIVGTAAGEVFLLANQSWGINRFSDYGMYNPFIRQNIRLGQFYWREVLNLLNDRKSTFFSADELVYLDTQISYEQEKETGHVHVITNEYSGVFALPKKEFVEHLTEEQRKRDKAYWLNDTEVVDIRTWDGNHKEFYWRVDVVNEDGSITKHNGTETKEIYPTLKLKSVLFAYLGDKSVSPNFVTSADDSSALHITLKNTSKEKDVQVQELSVAKDKMTITAAGLATGEGQGLSGILSDSSGYIAYARLADSSGNSSVEDVQITNGSDKFVGTQIIDGNYTVQLFNEKVSADSAFDYAGNFNKVGQVGLESGVIKNFSLSGDRTYSSLEIGEGVGFNFTAVNREGGERFGSFWQIESEAIKVTDSLNWHNVLKAQGAITLKGSIKVDENNTLILERPENMPIQSREDKGIVGWNDITYDGGVGQSATLHMNGYMHGLIVNGGTFTAENNLKLTDYLQVNNGSVAVFLGEVDVDNMQVAENGQVKIGVGKEVSVWNSLSLGDGAKIVAESGTGILTMADGLEVRDKVTLENIEFNVDNILLHKDISMTNGTLKVGKSLNMQNGETQNGIINDITFGNTPDNKGTYLFDVGMDELQIAGTASGKVKLAPKYGVPLTNNSQVDVFTVSGSGNLNGLILSDSLVTDRANNQTYFLTQNKDNKGKLDVKASRHNAVVNFVDCATNGSKVNFGNLVQAGGTPVVWDVVRNDNGKVILFSEKILAQGTADMHRLDKSVPLTSFMENFDYKHVKGNWMHSVFTNAEAGAFNYKLVVPTNDDIKENGNFNLTAEQRKASAVNGVSMDTYGIGNTYECTNDFPHYLWWALRQVDSNGALSENGFSDVGIRPAMQFDSDMVLFASNAENSRAATSVGTANLLQSVTASSSLELLFDDAHVAGKTGAGRVTGDVNITDLYLNGSNLNVGYNGGKYVDGNSYLSYFVGEGDCPQDFFAYGKADVLGRYGSGVSGNISLAGIAASTAMADKNMALSFFNEYGNGTSFAGTMKILPGTIKVSIPSSNLTYTVDVSELGQNLYIGADNVVELTGTGTLNKSITGVGTVKILNSDISANGGKMQADFEVVSDKTMNISGGNVKGSLKGNFNLTGDTAFSGRSLQGAVSGDGKLILNNDVQINTNLEIANLSGTDSMSRIHTLDMRQTMVGDDDPYDELTIGKLWGNANWAIDVDMANQKSDKIVLSAADTDKKITLNALNIIAEPTGSISVVGSITSIPDVASGSAKSSVVALNGDTGFNVYAFDKKYLVTLPGGTLTIKYMGVNEDGFKTFIQSTDSGSYSFAGDTNLSEALTTGGTNKTVFMNGKNLTGNTSNDGISVASGHNLSINGGNGTVSGFVTALNVVDGGILTLSNITFSGNTTDVANAGIMNIQGSVTMQKLTGDGTTEIQNGAVLNLAGGDYASQTFAGSGTLNLQGDSTLAAGNLDVAKTNIGNDKKLTLTGGADEANRQILHSVVNGEGSVEIGNTSFIQTDANNLQVAVANDGNLKITETKLGTLAKGITGNGSLEFAQNVRVYGAVSQSSIIVDAGAALDVYNTLKVTSGSITNNGSICINAGNLKSNVTNSTAGGTFVVGEYIMDNGGVYLYSSGTSESSTLTTTITNGKVFVMNDVISSLPQFNNTDVYLAGGANLTLRDGGTLEIGINIKGYGSGAGTLITDCESAGGDYKYVATMDNIQVPLVNKGKLELSKATTGEQIYHMDKMTSITNSGTLSIGADITLDRNISNSGTLNINGCLFSGEMTNSGTVMFKPVSGGTTAVCTITGTINNSGTVEIKEGNTFDTTAKVIGGTLKLGAIQFSNDNIQGLTELYVNGATYNFNAELGATPSVELIDAEKVTGTTLNLGTVTATSNETLSEWELGETKIAPYLKDNIGNTVAVGNTAVVFSGDNYRFTFSQAKEADGTTNKIGYLGIIKENGGELWQIVRNTQVSGYHCGNVSTYVLTGDYTEQLTGTEAPDNTALGTLTRTDDNPREFTIEGNTHFFAGGAGTGSDKKGIEVNAGDILNLSNISDIKNWNGYVVSNSGTLNFNGTNVLNSKIQGNGTFNNNGELTVTDTDYLGIDELINNGIIKINRGLLCTKIIGGILKIAGPTSVAVGGVAKGAAKLDVREIDIEPDSVLWISDHTSTLGEMWIDNAGTLELDIDTNKAFICGGKVVIRKDGDFGPFITTQSILADEIILGDSGDIDPDTLNVTGDTDDTVLAFGKISGIHDNVKLNITKGKVYALDEVNGKIILGENVSLDIDADNIKKNVEIGTNANLNLGDGTLKTTTITGTNNGTVNFLGKVAVETGTSIPKATFKNGSTLVLDAKTDTAPLTIITEINIDSGAKLYVNGAEKNGTYKIVSGTPIDSAFAGWTLSNIRGEDANGHKVKGKEYTVEGNVYSVFFKTAMPENTDLGNLLENADGTPLADWAEKVYDYFDTAYGDAGEAYTANAINSMASAGVLAGAQKAAATMVTQVAGNISANVGVGSRAILSGVRGQVSGVRNVSADVNDAASMRIDTVEQGKASEVMPTEYKDKVYDKQVWASYIHSKQKIDGLKTGSLTQNSTIQLNGVTVGADLWSGKKSFGGIAVTYADGNANSAQMSNSTKNEAKYYGISMYHRQDMGKYALTTDIGYTYNKNDITQHTTGITDEVTSKPKTHAYTVGMKLEREIYLSKACKIVPFTGARYTRLQNRDFSNSLGANTKVDNQNLVTVPVGLSFHSHLITTEGWKLGSILEGGYEWNFGNRHSTQEFGYGGAYNSIGFDVVDRGQYFVKAALTADYENMFFELGYRYSKGKSVRDNKWNFNANFIF